MVLMERLKAQTRDMYHMSRLVLRKKYSHSAHQVLAL